MKKFKKSVRVLSVFFMLTPVLISSSQAIAITRTPKETTTVSSSNEENQTQSSNESETSTLESQMESNNSTEGGGTAESSQSIKESSENQESATNDTEEVEEPEVLAGNTFKYLEKFGDSPEQLTKDGFQQTTKNTPVKVDLSGVAPENQDGRTYYMYFGGITNKVKSSDLAKDPSTATAVTGSNLWQPLGRTNSSSPAIITPSIIAGPKDASKGVYSYSYNFAGTTGDEGSGFDVLYLDKDNKVVTASNVNATSSISQKKGDISRIEEMWVNHQEHKVIAYGFVSLGRVTKFVDDGASKDIKARVKIVGEPVDNKGRVRYTMYLYNDASRNVGASFGIHMDISGKHQSSKMYSMGANGEGLYFQENTATSGTPILDNIPYYLSFYQKNFTSPNANEPVDKILNNDAYGGLSSLIANGQGYYSIAKTPEIAKDQIYPYQKHPGWMFRYGAQSVKEGQITRYDLETNVSNIQYMNLLVNYVDEKGQAIIPKKNESHRNGESYKETPPEINGYTFVKAEGIEEGVFDKDDVTITYTYKEKALSVSQTVTKLDGSSAEKVSKGEELRYTIKLNSDMKVVEPKSYYKQLSFAVPVDSNLTDIKNYSLVADTGATIGKVNYDPATQQMLGEVTAADNVESSENVSLQYQGTVKDVPLGTLIKGNAQVTSTYTDLLVLKLVGDANEVESLVDRETSPIINPNGGDTEFLPLNLDDTEKPVNPETSNLRIQYVSDFDFGTHQATVKGAEYLGNNDYGRDIVSGKTVKTPAFISVIDDRLETDLTAWELRGKASDLTLTSGEILKGAKVLLRDIKNHSTKPGPTVTPGEVNLSSGGVVASSKGQVLGNGTWSLAFGDLEKEQASTGVVLDIAPGNAQNTKSVYQGTIDWEVVVTP